MGNSVLISPKFPPEACGVGDYTYRLAQNMIARGEAVCVMTRAAGVSRPPDVRVMELPMRGWRDLGETLRAILKERPARVQLEYSPYGWSRWGCAWWLNALALRLRLAGVPFAVAFHEVPLHFIPRPDLLALGLAQRVHCWLLAATATGVISNTAQRIRMFRRWLPWHRETVVYRPNSATITVETINQEQRAELRRERGVARGALVACTFGMYQSGKNYEGLIKAVALARRTSEVRLWLMGDTRSMTCAQREKLDATVAAFQLQPATWWSGQMHAAAVSAHLQAADIFVLPQSDGHLTRSSAFMAAAAHGLAVIAVRNDVNQQEFTHGENVWLVDKSDAQHLASAIEHLAGDAGLRVRLGANLRSLYARCFDWPGQLTSEAAVRNPKILTEEVAGQ